MSVSTLAGQGKGFRRSVPSYIESMALAEEFTLKSHLLQTAYAAKIGNKAKGSVSRETHWRLSAIGRMNLSFYIFYMTG